MLLVAGVYLFFIFFGLGMLSFLPLVYGVKMYVTGQVPTAVLVARAHSVSPWSIFQTVINRRRVPFRPRHPAT
jgi:hypothetical protein